jgi:DNA-binding CsgD family transcriptional regulator
MTQSKADELIGKIYEAAMGRLTWVEVGRDIRELMDAQMVAMWAPGLDTESQSNLLMPFDEMQAKLQYFSHGLKINPYYNWGFATLSAPGRPVLHPLVVNDEQIISKRELIKSAFYNECLREYDLQHMAFGRLVDCEAIGFGIGRGNAGGPFSEVELQVIDSLRPHLKRALQLRRQMTNMTIHTGYGRAAFEALPGWMTIVSADMKVLVANNAAVNIAASPSFGLRLIRSGPVAGSSSFLSAAHRDDNKALASLVLSAASGQAGGTIRVRPPPSAPASNGLAVGVSPVPNGFIDIKSDEHPIYLTKGLALVVARQIAAPHSPVHTQLLRSLFELSKAEADIATTLAGGKTADEVARARGVSLETVRSQIKSLLRKMNALNLRDFERITASVETLSPTLAGHALVESSSHTAMDPNPHLWP